MTSIPSGGRLSYSTIAMFYAVFVLLCMLPLGAIADINKPPVATEQPKLSTKEDTKKSITLSGKDPEKKKLTYAIVSQPSHGTLTLSGNKATYVPTKDYFSPAGQPDSFTFKVNDGLVDSAPATVTINVTPVNDKPIALSGSVVAVKDSVREIALSATDVEEGMLTYTPAKKSKKGGAVALKANNIVTYTPKKNFVGADSFTFTVKDSQKGVSKAATVAVTVNGTNTAPKADAGADQNVDEKTTVTLDGSASTDTDGTIVSYAWVQTAGTAVTLSGATAAKPTFAAPEVTANETLTFELTVANSFGIIGKDSVSIAVINISAPHRGQFIDSPVSGLNWKTATRSGVTDANGYFEYDNSGETITFSIGEQELGTVGTDATVHVFDLEQSSLEMAKAKGARLAQLLQTLDADRNPDNGIQLTPEVKEEFKGASQLNFIASDDTWNTLMNSVSTLVDKPVVSLTVAYEHAAKNLPASNDCTLPDHEYYAQIGGKFSTTGMSCHRKAQLAVLYDYLLPRLNSTVSDLFDDPIVSNGEKIVNNRIKDSLEHNYVRTMTNTVIDSIKLVEDLDKEGGRVVFGEGLKALGGMAKSINDYNCSAGVNCDESVGFEVATLVLDFSGTSLSCAKNKIDNCADAIEKFLASDQVSESIGKSINLSPETIKGVVLVISNYMKVANDALSGNEYAAVGSILESTVKTANGTYFMSDDEFATRSGFTNLFNVMAEGANSYLSCVGFAYSGDGFTTCLERPSNYMFSHMTEIWYYSDAIGDLRAINSQARVNKASSLVLEELYKYPNFKDAFEHYNLPIGNKFTLGVADEDFINFGEAVIKKSGISFPALPIGTTTNVDWDGVASLVSSNLRQVVSLDDNYLSGRFGYCSDVKLGSLQVLGTNTSPVRIDEGGTLLFSADVNGNNARQYLFDWGDGTSTVSDLPASGHTFAKAGYFNVRLIPLVDKVGSPIPRQCDGFASSSYVLTDNLTVKPIAAPAGQPVALTVKSQWLPTTTVLEMEDSTCGLIMEQSQAGFKVTCTPNSEGVKRITLKDSKTGKIIDSRRSVSIVDASIDTDSDTMPDYWELQYGLDINVDDRAADLDDDKSTNIEEFHSGSDPSDKNSDVLRIYDNSPILNKSVLSITWNLNAGWSYDLCIAEEEIKSTIQNPIDEQKCTALKNGKWYAAVENRYLFSGINLDNLGKVVPGINYHLLMVARDTTVIPEKIVRVSNELVLVAESTTTTTTTSCSKPIKSILFKESFDSASIDATKWDVDQTGGSALLVDGKLSVLSNGSSRFPVIQTKANPFPATGNFSFYCKTKYNHIGMSGDGACVAVEKMLTPNGSATGTYDGGNSLRIWGDGIGPSLYAGVFNGTNQIFQVNSALDDQSHEYEFCVIGSQVIGYRDGVKVGEGTLPANWVRPTTIFIGNPVNGFGDWSTFDTDAVEVRQLEDSVTPPTDGLVAHWSFDDCTAKDVSGNGHDGVVNNSNCNAGIKGSSYKFNGMDSYISVNDAVDLRMSDKKMTASVFIKPSAKSGDMLILRKGVSCWIPGWGLGMHDFSGASAALDGYAWDGSNFSWSISKANGLVSDEWYHMVMTADGSVAKVYINGMLISSTDINSSINIDTNSPLFIGAAPEGNCGIPHAFFKGDIDDVRLYNRALSETEIQTLYQQGGGSVDNTGWTVNPTTGHYYKALDNCGNWEQCETAAQKVDAHLVVLDDQAENDWVASTFVPAVDTWGYWIGYTDKEQEGVWKTVTGITVTGDVYTHWYPGNPDNYMGHQNYAVMHAGNQWNDTGLSDSGVPTFAVIERITAPTGNANPFTVQAADETGTVFTVPAGKTQCTFTATGTWEFGGGTTTADGIGYKWSNDYVYVDTGSSFDLVAIKSGGSGVKIGSSANIAVSGGDTLHFRMNDSAGGFSDNSGALSVSWSCQ